MELISSRSSYWGKRLAPVVLFVSIAYGITASILMKDKVLFCGALCFAVFCWLYTKSVILKLMDEVWDNGEEFIIKNKNKEEHIRFDEITKITYSYLTKSITLILSRPCSWGTKISFTSGNVILGERFGYITFKELEKRIEAKSKG